MLNPSYIQRLFLVLCIGSVFFSCNNNTNKNRIDEDKHRLALNRNIPLSNSIHELVDKQQLKSQFGCDLEQPVSFFYQSRDFLPFWSDTGKLFNYTIQFKKYLDTAEYDGLVKDDYAYQRIDKLWMKLTKDTLSKTTINQNHWAQLDILLTNAFFNVCADLKQGRLQSDSLSWKNDTSKFTSFFIPQINLLEENNKPVYVFNALQPQYADYWKLRNSMKTFLKNRDTTNFVFIDLALLKGNLQDSISFYNALFSRLAQDSITDTSLHKNELPDSTVLSNAIKLWQEKHVLSTNGLLNSELLKQINLTDNRKYARLIVTLDRFKQLPDTVPQTFILVNLPAYQLNFWDDDTVVISSKVICGKPITPTPSLKSAVREIVTFPTWTVPNSIIKKEMLPQLKKNSAYLAKKGLGLYDHKGKNVDPATVDWTKYNKGIPFKIRQKSGERNALGAIKFNFDNDFDVYLHDTNERYLFQRQRRCLSHGCVRVEQWKNLALSIARYDSLKAEGQTKLKYNSDSIINWIANKEHHRIKINQPIPIIIAYLTCAAENGKLIFHDDIYNDDDRLIKRYFSIFNN